MVKREKVVELAAQKQKREEKKAPRRRPRKRRAARSRDQGFGVRARVSPVHLLHAQVQAEKIHAKTENRKPKTENPPSPRPWCSTATASTATRRPVRPEQGRGRGASGSTPPTFWPTPPSLWDYHLLAVPGGFSWGDEHGAGVILALRLKLALGSALQEFIQAGRLVIAICNGFQVLVNLGLLPGLPGRAGDRLAALIPNDCGNFRDAWVHLRSIRPSHCVFTRGLEPWNCRCATVKANSTPTPVVLAEIKSRGQIASKYALPTGPKPTGASRTTPTARSWTSPASATPAAWSWASCPIPRPTSPPSSTPPGPRRRKPAAAGANPTPEQDGAGLAIFRNAVQLFGQAKL